MSQQVPHILVVDDDKDILSLLRDRLEDVGYMIYTAGSGEEALEKITNYPIDLVILDIMLPGISGLEVCKWTREQFSFYLPIIIISVKGDEENKVKAITMGANDYLSKPLSIALLQARVKAYLQDTQTTGSVFIAGPLSVNFLQHNVHVNRYEISLTPNEYKILEILILNRGRLVSLDTLTHELWPGENEFDREKEIGEYIHNLRKKIERPARCQFIKIHHRLGYRFKAE